MRPAESIARFARQHLDSILHESGTILYSAADTIAPNSIYLLGLNPGGDPTVTLRSQTIGHSIDALPTRTDNAYFDEAWNGRPVGKAPVQRRITTLLEHLTGSDAAARRVPASNLIFQRTRSAADIEGFRNLADRCWRVHEEIIRVARPRLLLVFGNSGLSPYAELRRRFESSLKEEPPIDAGHRPWKCRAFTLPDHFTVIGLPHLSRYDITKHSTVIDWIKQHLDGS